MEIVINNLSKNYGKNQPSKMCPLLSILECTGYLGVMVQENKSDENFGNAFCPLKRRNQYERYPN